MLNLIVAALTVILVGTAVALRSHVNPGLLGFALVMVMELGQTLSGLVQNWSQLETSLGAISRVQDFAKETPNEEKFIAARLWELAVDWPKYGEVRFLDTTIGYGSNELEAILRNINLHIQAGQKLGYVVERESESYYRPFIISITAFYVGIVKRN